jgi:hypothetical protein
MKLFTHVRKRLAIQPLEPPINIRIQHTTYVYQKSLGHKPEDVTGGNPIRRVMICSNIIPHGIKSAMYFNKLQINTRYAILY